MFVYGFANGNWFECRAPVDFLVAVATVQNDRLHAQRAGTSTAFFRVSRRTSRTNSGTPVYPSFGFFLTYLTSSVYRSVGKATLEKFSLGIFTNTVLVLPDQKYLIVLVLYLYYGDSMPRKRSTGRAPRTTVNVPKPLYEAIRNIVEDKKAVQGYVSVDDFVRDTLRRRLEELRPTAK